MIFIGCSLIAHSFFVPSRTFCFSFELQVSRLEPIFVPLRRLERFWDNYIFLASPKSLCCIPFPVFPVVLYWLVLFLWVAPLSTISALLPAPMHCIFACMGFFGVCSLFCTPLLLGLLGGDGFFGPIGQVLLSLQLD